VAEFEAAAEDPAEAGSEVGADRLEGADALEEAAEPPQPPTTTTTTSARMQVHLLPALARELAPAISPVASTARMLASVGC